MEVVIGLLLYMLELGGGGVVPRGGVGGGLALLVLRRGGGGGGASMEGGTLGGSIWWERGGRAGGAPPPLMILGESERTFKAGLARWRTWAGAWRVPLGCPFRLMESWLLKPVTSEVFPYWAAAMIRLLVS